MKKLVSVFGKLSLAIIILFATSTSFAATPTNNIPDVNTSAASNVNASAAPAYTLSVNNGAHSLFIKQTSGTSGRVMVTISDSRGIVLHSGTIAGSGENIDLGNMDEGKYTITLQKDNATQVCRLLVI
jgi:hypothetical protein